MPKTFSMDSTAMAMHFRAAAASYGRANTEVITSFEQKDISYNITRLLYDNNLKIKICNEFADALDFCENWRIDGNCLVIKTYI